MKTIKSFIIPTLVVILLAFSCGCPPESEKYCCEQYKTDDGGKFDDDRLAYCTYHRQAAIGFVRRGSDSLDMVNRLNNFRLFYDTIGDCRTIACIEAAIGADTVLTGFPAIYEIEHQDAEDFTDLPDSVSKADLILCGFRNAVVNLEESKLGI